MSMQLEPFVFIHTQLIEELSQYSDEAIVAVCEYSSPSRWGKDCPLSLVKAAVFALKKIRETLEEKFDITTQIEVLQDAILDSEDAFEYKSMPTEDILDGIVSNLDTYLNSRHCAGSWSN